MLREGDIVEEYAVEGLLGEGGIASVWAVRHRESGRRAALKVLYSTHPNDQQRLLREGRIQQTIRHPNILPVEDILDIGGVIGLLMVQVSGPSLKELMVTKPLTPAEAAAVLAPVLRALDVVHRRGVVHRDLKPANILLEPMRAQLVPRVSDFGLAYTDQEETLTQSGAVMGTPAYAAPEQLRDATADARADLWAVGVMLYELLLGRRPFDGDTPAGLIAAHTQPPDLSGLPEAFAPIVRDLLQSEPAQRPSSAAQVADRLEALLGGRAPLHSSGALFLRAGRYVRLPSKEPPPHNLPIVADSFVSRADELDRLRALVAEHALVTVTGVGGCGKTRLVVELGRRQLWRRAGGVWFIDLTEARDAQDIVLAARGALGCGDDIAEAIAARPEAMFIFDNFEHLLPFAHETLGRWREAANDAVFVVTSRAPLGLDEEQALPLEMLSTTAATALFVDRMRSRSTPAAARELSAVPELVDLLDGLPLAIELAAARTKLMTPEQIRQRLSKRFSLLRSRDSSLPPRQRTLKATLEWSWELLSPQEQDALARWSCFAGGFLPDAAGRLLADPEQDADALIGSLLKKSLLRDQSGRLRMLVSVKAFAESKLSAAARGDAEQRHGDFFASWGTPAEIERLYGPERAVVWPRVQADRANLWAAAERAIARRDVRVTAQTILLVLESAFYFGPAAAGIALGEAAAALALPGAYATNTRNYVARLMVMRGDVERAIGILRDSIAHAVSAGELSAEGGARNMLGMALFRTGDLHGSLEQHSIGLDIARRQNDIRSVCCELGSLGLVRMFLGQITPATEDMLEANAIAHQLGDHDLENTSLNTLSQLYAAAGELEKSAESVRRALAVLDEAGLAGTSLHDRIWMAQLIFDHHEPGPAREYLERALACSLEKGSARAEYSVYRCLGVLADLEDRTDDAVRFFRDAEEGLLRIQNDSLACWTLLRHGELWWFRGQTDRALPLLERALAVGKEQLNPFRRADLLGGAALAEIVRGDLGAAEARLAEAEAVSQAAPHFLIEARTLYRRCVLARHQGKSAQAETAKATLEAICQRHTIHPRSSIGRLLRFLDAGQGMHGGAR